MALTKIKGGDGVTDNTIKEADLLVDVAPTNDYVLTAKSSAAGGLTWAEATAGATGGGSDKVFWENSNTITTSYTISNNMNAGTFGPVTVNNGVTVTVGSGETWTVIYHAYNNKWFSRYHNRCICWWFTSWYSNGSNSSKWCWR